MSEPTVVSGGTNNSAPSESQAQSQDSQQPQSGVVSATSSKPAPQPKETQNHQQQKQQPTEQQKAIARKLKLKVDGRDEELDESEVVRWAQMGRSAQKRFQEAAQARKQAEDFIRMLKEDPVSVMTNPAVGIDPRKFAEEYLSKELQKETLSPEQKRIRDLEDKLRKHDEDLKKAEEQSKKAEFQKLQEHYKQDFDKKFTDALQGSGLPKSPKTIQRMADYMVMALKNNLDVEPSHVVELVRQDYISEIQDLFSQTDGDKLLKILGDGVANKIRKADLARLRSSQQQPISQPTPTQEFVAEDKPKKVMNVFEWRAEIDKRVKN